MCILLVDDEPLIRLLMAEALVDAGFAVREASTGDEAAALIDARPVAFSCLVTDVHMPGRLDGLQLGRLFRLRHPQLPIVYMTGRPDVVVGAGILGPRQVLASKPLAPSRLLEQLRRLLPDAPTGFPG